MNFIINSPKSSVAFTVFNYPVYFYGIIMVFAIFVGLTFVYFLIKNDSQKKEAEKFLDFSSVLILFSLVGARLFYVVGQFNYYKLNLIEIFKIHKGGLSIYGAIIFGILALFFYLRKNKLEIYKYFDKFALVMPLSQAIGRFGNYFNQEAYGAPTTGFIKLYIDSKHRPTGLLNIEYYHPAFLYESVLDLILFVFLFILFFKFKKLKNGTIFYAYLISYGLIRIFVEYFRIDSVLNIFTVPIAQIISFLIIIVALIGLFRIYKKA